MVHGVHHDHPNDPLRLVMPPAVSVPLAALFLVVFVAVLGTPLAWSVGAGFLAGYLAYDMLHYALHHHRNPRTGLERRLRELHMRHHFEDDKQRLRHQRAVVGHGLRNVLAPPRQRRLSHDPPRRATNAPAYELRSCPEGRRALSTGSPPQSTGAPGAAR